MNTKRLKIFLPLLLFTIPALACGQSILGTRPAPIVDLPGQPPATQVVVQSPLTTIISDEDSVLIELYQRVNPSVVSIVDYTSQGNTLAPTSQGSGFVYDGEGHIVTNAHVVHGAAEVEVSFAEGTILRAQILGEDLHSDLAVLKVDSLPTGVQFLPLGDINEVAVGQTVVAIGNPFGLGGTLTRGIVSALGRTIPALTSFSIPQSIQTDAPINPGNSGGPLLNMAGEVIGVNAQIETGSQSRANSGVGFAIPVSIVKLVIPDLIQNGKHEWAWMGVYGLVSAYGGGLPPALIDAMDLPVNKGAYVTEVVNGGPADKAGLRGATRQSVVDGQQVAIGGDVIIAINGQKVNSFEDMLIYIALSAKPNQEVVLTIIRDGKQTTVTVKLESRPTDINEFQLP